MDKKEEYNELERRRGEEKFRKEVEELLAYLDDEDQWNAERCIHCGAVLKTPEEIKDKVCASCATALLCDEEVSE